MALIISQAGGSVGKHITEELLKTGLHTVTALTRIDSPSKTKIPTGTKVVHIDYSDESSIVAALQGQQFLIITLSVLAPPDQHSKLVHAAAKAGVPYVMPNHYGADIANEQLSKELLTAHKGRAHVAEIESTGASWIALACSFWYEFSLVMGPEWYGFDFKSRKATFYDDGTTRINTSTWEQCGRAVAALLSLKELPDDEHDRALTISNWRNKPLYISSFLLSQREMFESWKRVTGDRDEDWTIEYQPTGERYAQGLERMKAAIAGALRRPCTCGCSSPMAMVTTRRNMALLIVYSVCLMRTLMSAPRLQRRCLMRAGLISEEGPDALLALCSFRLNQAGYSVLIAQIKLTIRASLTQIKLVIQTFICQMN